VVGVTSAVHLLMSGEESHVSDPLLQSFASLVVAEDREVFSAARALAEKLAILPAEGLAGIKEALWREGGRRLKKTDGDEGGLFRDCLSAGAARVSLAAYRKQGRSTARKRR
jgi:enoyl-CoA hydratase/carnithine racemase